MNAGLFPGAIAIDVSGNMYINSVSVVRKINATTGNISTIAGTGVEGYHGENIDAQNAYLEGLTGITVDQTGNIYISFRGARLILGFGN